VTNARDAMLGDSGRISLTTENAAVDPGDPELAPGHYISVAVADNGCGMSKDVMARAVEPFYTTKDIGEGNGLELSQVYGFAKQSSGMLRLSSAKGVGTTARLYLPRAQNGLLAEPDVEPAFRPLSRRSAATVLVVDDDPDVLAVTADGIDELGYRVQTAQDATSALAIVEGGAPIDLSLTDYAMPAPCLAMSLRDAL